MIESAVNRDRTIIENQVPKGPDTTILETPAPGSASSGLLLAPGATFLEYRLDRPLEKASGEAELWLMTRVDNGQQAVLKLYHRGLTFKEDVAEAVSKLDTSHVVRIYTRGRTDEAYPRHYEIMEYIVHGSLADMMKPGPLPPSAIRNVLRELSDALDHLHNAKIYHRDIKPANILVRTTNPLDLVLTDFGISSVSDLSRHQTSANRTAAYSAPEAITGVISRTCDWWSLGVIVLEVLTGRHPFSGLQENTINYELVTRGILVPTDLPAEWRQLAMGLLTKDDAKRWTGKEVKSWLDGQTDLPVGYAYEDEASRAAKAKQLERPSSFKPYEFQKTEYVDKESLALAMGRAECWDDAVKRVGRGFIGRWLKSFETEDVVNAVLDIEEDNALNADQKLAAMLLVMNAQVPLIWKGEVVTHDWLADNQETATALLKSSLPAWVNRVRKDSWLQDVRERRDRILQELKPHLAALPLNKQLARDLTLLPDARLISLADARWRSLATASDAPLQAILSRTEMTEAEAIMLLTCDQARFTTRQQAWVAYMDAAARRVDDLHQRARTTASLIAMPSLAQRLTQITQEVETEYQSHAQRAELARNDGALRQRMSRCQQEIAQIPQRAWDAAKAAATTQLEALVKGISARPTSLPAMQEQQEALAAIQSTLSTTHQECSRQKHIQRYDAAVNQLFARCAKALQELHELHDALTRFDELLAARQTAQAQRLLETAQGIFSPRDFDLEAAGRKLRELTYAYEEPSTRLNVLSPNWMALLAGSAVKARAIRLLRWPSVRSQIAGIYSTVTTQRKALAPYANTELAVTAERVFVTIEHTLHSLESQWHQVLRRDRMLLGGMAAIAALILGAVVGTWAVSAIRFRMNVNEFEKAISINKGKRAVVLASRLREKYPPAALLLVAHDQALAALAELEKTRAAAKAIDADTAAKSLWSGAVELTTVAQEAADRGDFVTSAKRYIDANAEFTKATASVNRARSSRLIDEAEQAKSKGNMELLKALSEKALSCDPTSSVAKALLVEALGPLFKITTELAGKEISGATITVNGTPLAAKSPTTLKLKIGASYHIQVSLPPNGATRYTASECNFTVQRNGEEHWNAKLEVYKGPIEGQPWTVPDLGMEFVWIQVMNCWVGKYEVTNGEYRQFKPDHSSLGGDWGDIKYSLNGEREPVVEVNFFDVSAYAKWLTTREHQIGRLLEGYSYKLPTRAEWWTIGKCGDDRLYPWGNDWPPKYGNYLYGNYGQWEARTKVSKETGGYDDGFIATCPVEKSGRNDWGLFGVGGNVCEWTMKNDGSFDITCDIAWSQGFPMKPDDARLNTEQFSGFVSRSSALASDRRYNLGFRLILSR